MFCTVCHLTKHIYYDRIIVEVRQIIMAKDHTKREAVLYDVLRTLPHMILVLYAFRGHWRFGRKTTYLLTFIVRVIEMILPQIDKYEVIANVALIDILEIIIYIVFIFLVLKEHKEEQTWITPRLRSKKKAAQIP